MLQTPKVFLLIASRPIFAISVNACSLSFQNLSMAPSKVVAEYAKSNRSTCKKCYEPIQSKTLRLILVSRHMARRLDITKWHHFSCFPISSSNSDPKTIIGFSSLKLCSFQTLCFRFLSFLEYLFMWFFFVSKAVTRKLSRSYLLDRTSLKRCELHFQHNNNIIIQVTISMLMIFKWSGIFVII